MGGAGFRWRVFCELAILESCYRYFEGLLVESHVIISDSAHPNSYLAPIVIGFNMDPFSCTTSDVGVERDPCLKAVLL